MVAGIKCRAQLLQNAHPKPCISGSLASFRHEDPAVEKTQEQHIGAVFLGFGGSKCSYLIVRG